MTSDEASLLTTGLLARNDFSFVRHDQHGVAGEIVGLIVKFLIRASIRLI